MPSRDRGGKLSKGAETQLLNEFLFRHSGGNRWLLRKHRPVRDNFDRRQPVKHHISVWNVDSQHLWLFPFRVALRMANPKRRRRAVIQTFTYHRVLRRVYHFFCVCLGKSSISGWKSTFHVGHLYSDKRVGWNRSGFFRELGIPIG